MAKEAEVSEGKKQALTPEEINKERNEEHLDREGEPIINTKGAALHALPDNARATANATKSAPIDRPTT